jgi:hypothetical protein
MYGRRRKRERRSASTGQRSSSQLEATPRASAGGGESPGAERIALADSCVSHLTRLASCLHPTSPFISLTYPYRCSSRLSWMCSAIGLGPHRAGWRRETMIVHNNGVEEKVISNDGHFDSLVVDDPVPAQPPIRPDLSMSRSLSWSTDFTDISTTRTASDPWTDDIGTPSTSKTNPSTQRW